MNKFFLDETATKGKYLIKLNIEEKFLNKCNGSLHILQARLLHLSYPSYLRMCRDLYDGEIIGKNIKYPTVYFTDIKKVDKLIKELNNRLNLLLNEMREEYEI